VGQAAGTGCRAGVIGKFLDMAVATARSRFRKEDRRLRRVVIRGPAGEELGSFRFEYNDDEKWRPWWRETNDRPGISVPPEAYAGRFAEDLRQGRRIRPWSPLDGQTPASRS
jgi:hypothetical protein